MHPLFLSLRSRSAACSLLELVSALRAGLAFPAISPKVHVLEFHIVPSTISRVGPSELGFLTPPLELDGYHAQHRGGSLVLGVGVESGSWREMRRDGALTV
jgi:hypothetical protein